MPIHGLVLNLVSDAPAKAAALSALQESRHFTIGAQTPHEVAVVMESTSADEDADLWRWLMGLEGVASVGVSYSNFEDLGDIDDVSHLWRMRCTASKR